jgi:uncharacterized pyridoxamine 5'-phosphate oxidase family protein
MEVESFAELEEEFLARIASVVWCNVASVDTAGRPRSRIMHPVWEVVDGVPVGWVGSRRNAFKVKHLANNPYLSLAYIAEATKPVYVDCKAEWVDDMDLRKHAWDLTASLPPPLGYDPAPIYISYDHENFGLLKLTPWRVELTTVAVVPPVRNVWHAPQP